MMMGLGKGKLLLIAALVLSMGSGWTAEPPAVIQEIVAIKIPRIDLEKATLRECLEFLSQRVRDLDARKPGGISFLSAGFGEAGAPNEGDVVGKTASYSAENVRVDKVLAELARLYGVRFHVTDVGVVMTPPGFQPFPNLKAKKGRVYYTYGE